MEQYGVGGGSLAAVTSDGVAVVNVPKAGKRDFYILA